MTVTAAMVGNVGLEKYFDLDERHRFYKIYIR